MELTAEQMFKEIGYEKEEFKDLDGHLLNITYCKNKELNENIEFYLDDKYMYIDNGITIDELKAINKKVEELKWE